MPAKLFLEPVDEFFAEQLLVELVVGPLDEPADVTDDDQAGVSKLIADLLQEREAPTLIRHANEQEVHFISPFYRGGEHLFGSTLVAVVTVGHMNDQGALLLDRSQRRRGLSAAEEAAEHTLGLLWCTRLRSPAEVLEIPLKHIAVVGIAAIPARHMSDDLLPDEVLIIHGVHIAHIVDMSRAVTEREDVELLVGIKREPPRNETGHEVVRHTIPMFVLERPRHVEVERELHHRRRHDTDLLEIQAKLVS